MCRFCNPLSHSFSRFDLHVCVFVWEVRVREREKGGWVIIQYQEAGAIWDVSFNYCIHNVGAVILFVCMHACARACLSACVCSLAEEMKSILRLYSSMKSSLCVWPSNFPSSHFLVFILTLTLNLFQSSLLSLLPLSLRVSRGALFYDVSTFFLCRLLKLVETKLPPACIIAAAFRKGAFLSQDIQA